MLNIEPAVPLIKLASHENADDFGILELIDNGYEDEMEDLYIPLSTIDGGDSVEEVTSIIVTNSRTVPLGMWIRGSLYAEGSMVVYTIKGREGLWTVNED